MVDMSEFISRFPELRVVRQRQVVCSIHGEYTQKEFEAGNISECPDCAEQAQKEKEQARQKAEYEKHRKIHVDKMIGNARIPKRFATKTLENFTASTPEQEKIHKIAINYANEFKGEHSGRNLALLGNAGNGKTHLACAIAMKIMQEFEKSARFLSVSTINRMVRESKSFESEYKESEVIDTFGSYYDLLIIDEVGVQSGTDAEARALFDVFNTRYENMKPTIFISNLDLNGLKSALGDRVIDRLREDDGKVLSFNWESYRR